MRCSILFVYIFLLFVTSGKSDGEYLSTTEGSAVPVSGSPPPENSAVVPPENTPTESPSNPSQMETTTSPSSKEIIKEMESERKNCKTAVNQTKEDEAYCKEIEEEMSSDYYVTKRPTREGTSKGNDTLEPGLKLKRGEKLRKWKKNRMHHTIEQNKKKHGDKLKNIGRGVAGQAEEGVDNAAGFSDSSTESPGTSSNESSTVTSTPAPRTTTKKKGIPSVPAKGAGDLPGKVPGKVPSDVDGKVPGGKVPKDIPSEVPADVPNFGFG